MLQNTWDNLKRPARERYLALAQTGAGGEPLTELENLVLDVLGRDSAYIVGIANKATRPSFARSTTNSNSVVASHVFTAANSSSFNGSIASHLDGANSLDDTSYSTFEHNATGMEC